MACNQRGRNLDKSTRHHLSALDAFIQAEAEASKPKQEGEFTIAEYREKMEVLGQFICETAARRKMAKLIKSGVLTSRKSTESGNPFYYRFV